MKGVPVIRHAMRRRCRAEFRAPTQSAIHIYMSPLRISVRMRVRGCLDSSVGFWSTESTDFTLAFSLEQTLFSLCQRALPSPRNDQGSNCCDPWSCIYKMQIQIQRRCSLEAGRSRLAMYHPNQHSIARISQYTPTLICLMFPTRSTFPKPRLVIFVHVCVSLRSAVQPRLKVAVHNKPAN